MPEPTTTGQVIRTSRLRLRPWTVQDAEAALAVYGSDDVARWLSPAVDGSRTSPA